MNYKAIDKVNKKERQQSNSTLPLMTEHPSSKPLTHGGSSQWAAARHDYFMLVLQRRCLAAERQGKEKVINNASAPRPPNTGPVMLLLHGDQ